VTSAPSRDDGQGGGAVFLVVAVVYLAAVFAISHVPGQHFVFPLRIWDKAVHFAEFVPLGFLLTGWIARRRWAPRSSLALTLVATALVAFFGAADELHQWFVPNRSATIGDAVADGLGGLVGAAIGALSIDPRRRRKPAAPATPSGSRTT
jgi:VanZ family protein